MKKIEINFVDFWPGFNKTDNFIYNFLKKKYQVEISKNPKYIFCSLFGKKHLKYKNAVKILLIGENIAPDFNLYDYAIGFYDIKFEDRYLRYNILFDESIIKLLNKKNKKINSKFCAFVYKKNKLNPMRKDIYLKLNEYKKVDSAGKYLNNIGKTIGTSKMDKINFQKQYKFIIACENQAYPGYNTEKLLEAFASGGIPVYWGDPQINEVYNKEAFLNCSNFENLDELKNKIIELDNNDEKYLEILSKPVFNKNFNFQSEKIKLHEFLRNIFEQDFDKARKVKLVKGFYIYEYYKIYFLTAFIFDKFLKLKQIIRKFIK